MVNDRLEEQETNKSESYELADLQRRLENLQGVVCASVTKDDEGQISGVNLIAREGTRSRFQLSNDVISMVFIDTRVRLSRSDVHIVFSAEYEPMSDRAGRAILSAIRTVYEREKVCVEVTLRTSQDEICGRECLRRDAADHEKLVFSASASALSAAQSLIRGDCVLTLRDSTVVKMDGQAVAVTVVSVSECIADGPLVGAVPIKEDPATAGAKAALDAINRIFTF